MNNLVIGNTSQLSYFFPESFFKISSRNIDIDFIRSKNWSKVFLCFGESRKFIKNKDLYNEVNINLTIKTIDFLLPFSEKIVVYSTCELWNGYSGKIDLSLPFKFLETDYILSKYLLTEKLKKDEKYKNVIIAYPFNFNSTHRNENFLFGKIFNSIISKKMIEIGDTYFYRDMVHPKFVVDQSIIMEKDQIIGSGRLTFVNEFIRDLYSAFDLEYDNFIEEKLHSYNEYDKKNEYYLNSNQNLFSYKQLLDLTINDLKKINR